MVAFIFVVLATPTERTGDGTLVVIRHFGLAAGVGRVFLALHHEALVPTTVWDMDGATFLVSGIAPEHVLGVCHIRNVLQCLSRGARALISASVASALPLNLAGIQVLVQLFFQPQLSEQHRQILLGVGSCLLLGSGPTIVREFSAELGLEPEQELVAALRSRRSHPA